MTNKMGNYKLSWILVILYIRENILLQEKFLKILRYIPFYSEFQREGGLTMSETTVHINLIISNYINIFYYMALYK